MRYKVNEDELRRWKPIHPVLHPEVIVEIASEHITNGTHVCIDPTTLKSFARPDPLPYTTPNEIHISYFNLYLPCEDFFNEL